MRRRVCVVTGTRAEYGLLRPVMRAIQAHRKLELQLIATGIHLLRAHGRTVHEIRRDGWRIDATVPMQTGRDSRLDAAVGLGRGIAGIARALDRLGSRIVLVLGDRIEALAGALAGVTAGCFVAHIHGGDVAVGDVDDTLRHAITKLAHIHFAATRQAARRIARLGERPEHVYPVGAPGLDNLRQLAPPDEAWIRKRLRLDPTVGFAVVVQHPIGMPVEREYLAMQQTLRAVAQEGLAGVIVYPCTDPGYSGIVRAIRDRPERGTWRVFRSLANEDFLRALMAARVIVGNSSSGIIESAAAGTPAVNIGPRQQGRQKCGPSVVDCDYGQRNVRTAIRRALGLRPRRRTVYGDGRAGERIARILAEKPLPAGLRRKQLAF